MVAGNRPVGLLDQIGAGNAGDAVGQHLSGGGIIADVEQQMVCMRGGERRQLAMCHLLPSDLPGFQKPQHIFWIFAVCGGAPVGVMFTIIAIQLPGLRATTKHGERPVKSGSLQGAGADDGACSPGAMQQGRLSLLPKLCHMRQDQAVWQALRSGDCKLTIFGCRPDVEERRPLMVGHIVGRCHLRKIDTMRDHLAKGL